MAKTVALQRSTSQVVTIDTINNLIEPLGPVLSGSIPTTSTGLPAKLQNTNAVFLGDAYTLVVTGVGDIEVRQYDIDSNTWVLSSDTYSGTSQMPICLQIVNGNLVAIWVDSNGTSTVASSSFYNGTDWSPRIDSALTTYERLIITAVAGTISEGDTITEGAASGTVISYDIPSGVLIVDVSTTAAFTAGALSDTTSAATATITSATSVLDGNTGGNSIVWHRAVWFATKAGLGHFFPGRITLSAPLTSPRFILGDIVSAGGTKEGVITEIGTQGTSPIQYYIDVDQTTIVSPTPFDVGDIITSGTDLQTITYTAPTGSFSIGDTVTFTGGIEGIISETPTSLSIIVGLVSGTFPGSGTLSNTTSGATASISTASGIFNASATVASYCFGTVDTGSNPSIDDPLLNSITTQGCFSFWNGNLYFVRPDTGFGIKLMSLDPTWNSPAPTPPEWTTVPGVTGVTSSGVMTQGSDIGNYCLFVNKLDELCLMHSGPGGTRLAKSSVAAFPTFTDLTIDKLPVEISASINLGISCYIDNRRRLNELQWFFVRNSALLSNDTTLAFWNGSDSVEIQTLFTGSDFLLPAGRNGEIRTWTNLQPACSISSVNTSTPPSFPGRTVITYTVKDTLSRNVDVFGEYSIDGDTWYPMTEGDGDDGDEALASSPAGTTHTFYWDAFADLDGDFEFMNMRIIARISVASNETVPDRFVAVIQEDYLRQPAIRNESQYRLIASQGTGLFYSDDTVTGATSGTTALSQFAGTLLMLLDTPSAAINVSDTVTVGSASGTVTAVEVDRSLYLTLTSNIGFSVGDLVSDALTGAEGQILDLSGVIATIYVLSGTWTTPAGSITDETTSTTTTFTLGLLTDAVVVIPTVDVFTSGAFTDTTTGATATVSIAALTESVYSTVGEFIPGEIINDSRTKVLTLTGVVGFNVGDTVTAGLAVGTIGLIDGSDITVLVSAGTFAPGAILDTTTVSSSTILSVAESTATIIAITSDIISTSTVAADETTDIEEFNQATSIATRAHAQLVFQGRLSTNQTRLRFLKMTIRGTGDNPQVKVSVFVSGGGPNNQYNGTYSTFQTLPVSDLELIISNTDLMMQPSATGKRYSVVVEFDLARDEIGTVSTPFFRHE